MDINVKNFKYSTLKKFICLSLCLITLMISTGLAIMCSLSYSYDNGEIPDDFTDSSAFSNELWCDINNANNHIDNLIRKDALKKELDAKQSDIVDEAYKKFVERNSMLKREYKNSEEFGKEYLDGYEYTTFVDESINYWEDEEIQIETDIIINNGSNLEKTFDFSFTDVASECENYSEGSALENVDEDEVKGILNNLYDTFKTNTVEWNYNYSYYDNDKASLKYLVEYGEYSYSNTENFDKSKVTQNEIYYIYDAGKTESNGISEKGIKTISEVYDSEKSKNYTGYFYLDFSDESVNKANIVNHLANYDEYQELKDFHGAAVNTMMHFNLYIALAVISLIASFVFGFAYLLVAGRKDENSPAKLAITDKIPFEIHLAVLVAVGWGASILMVEMINHLDYSKLVIWAGIIYSAIIWTLFMEFCASVARYAKSEKIFYRNSLIIMILRLFAKIIKKSFLLYIKINRKIFGGIKRFYEYTPKKFSKKVFALAALYIFANVILFTFTAICFCGDLAPVALLSSFVIIAGNGIVLAFMLRYIKQLDEIIWAASNHQEYGGNINALPKSLKILAEGMNYTSVELQNAISKAVKDERLRTELITNVSHDLKTPLTSIINYVDLLSKCEIDDENAQKYIKVIDEKGAKLKRLIDDLIEASKVTSGNITVNASPLNLSELCLQATVDVQSDFEKAGLDLVIKNCQNAPIIFADGAKTFRIIENLLSNARKYSALHSRVYVSVYKEGANGVFEIKNISAQALDISPDELTERFVRGDKSRNQEGNGLGLSIAKELCRVQNGTLEIVIDGDLFKAKVKLPLNK